MVLGSLSVSAYALAFAEIYPALLHSSCAINYQAVLFLITFVANALVISLRRALSPHSPSSHLVLFFRFLQRFCSLVFDSVSQVSAVGVGATLAYIISIGGCSWPVFVLLQRINQWHIDEGRAPPPEQTQTSM